MGKVVSCGAEETHVVVMNLKNAVKRRQQGVEIPEIERTDWIKDDARLG